MIEPSFDWLQGAGDRVAPLADFIISYLQANAGVFFTHPLVRAIGLVLLVLATIWAIALIYSGTASNSEFGPVVLRAHVGRSLDRSDVVVPRSILPMALDGVIATCDVYYVYLDRKQRKRRTRLKAIRHARIHVKPNNIPPLVRQNMLYGCEVPPGLRTEDVCFPPFDLPNPPERIEPTSEFADEHARANNFEALWTEDDSAIVVTISHETLSEMREARTDFLTSAANTARIAREKPRLARIIGSKLARALGDKRGLLQPNVMGNIVLKFRFSKNPFFILSRHPDRDLKMTAWLTVLTSLFAMVMEAWPKADGTQHRAANSVIERPIVPRPGR